MKSEEAEIWFVDDGVKVIHVDLDRMKVACFLPLKEASNRFWKLIDEQLKSTNMTTVCLLDSSKKTIIEIDGCSRRIMHEMWDPEASFVLSELERLGTDDCDCGGGAVA